MRTVSNVHMIFDGEAKRFTGEAFVTFANVNEIEVALHKIDGKRIRNTYVKVFRSSEEQFQYYYDNSAMKTSLKNPMNLPIANNSTSNSGKIMILFD